MGRSKDPYYHIEQLASQEAKARGLSYSQRAVVAKAARQAAERAAEEAVVRAIAAEVPRGVQRAIVTPKPIAASPSAGSAAGLLDARPPLQRSGSYLLLRPPRLLVLTFLFSTRRPTGGHKVHRPRAGQLSLLTLQSGERAGAARRQRGQSSSWRKRTRECSKKNYE
jgi:hypothetical protein